MADLLDLDILMGEKSPYKVIITSPAAGWKTISGILQSELAITAGADYNTPWAMQGKQEALNTMMNQASSFLNSTVGTSLSQVSLQSLSQTVAFWTGSNKPAFSISLLLLALRSGQNVLDPVKQLLGTVLPTQVGGDTLGVLKAPMDYKPVAGHTRAEGALDFHIGGWFRATSCVVRSINVTFSKELVVDNSPLSAAVTIEFEPWKMPLASGGYSILDFFTDFGKTG